MPIQSAKVINFASCYVWWAGRSGDRIPVGASFSASVHTDPGAHPASCTLGTGFFLEVRSGRDVALNPHPHLVPWSRKSRAIPPLPLWAVRPVYSLSVCTSVKFTFTLPSYFVKCDNNIGCRGCHILNCGGSAKYFAVNIFCVHLGHHCNARYPKQFCCENLEQVIHSWAHTALLIYLTLKPCGNQISQKLHR